MGILRADRITGLGGANAITGSVNFTNDGATGTGDYLRVDRKDNSDFNLSTNDFTIEFWMYSRNVGASLHLVTFAASTVSASSDAGFYVRQYGGVVQGYCFEGNNSIGAVATGSISTFRWYHIAYVRSGSTFTMYLDGTSTATATSSEAANFDSSWNLNIGSAYTDVYHYNGYLSNLRIVNGTAIYTSNFTPPPNQLEKTSNTVLLACQSSGNALQEGTNKNIHLVRSSNNNTPPEASRFIPNSPVGFSTTTDVGSQYGTTFDGFGSFATSTYMVPPGGNTRERNRGRAVFGGGESPTADNVMEYINIQSGGRTFDFGDHSAGGTPSGDAVASSTRGVFTVHASPNTNALEFITIANTGNSQDFGDQTSGGVAQEAAASNSTRGLFAGGIFPGSTVHDITEYITIATLGNAIDFGNLIASVTSNTGVADATRALFAGGIGPSSPFPTVNRIEYFTIANTGNATDFGDLTFSARYPGSAGDSTRGVFMGGATPSAINTICFVTIQTTGDATDYGDLVTASHDIAATSNNTRAIMGGGGTPSRTNTIEQLTIQTNGNATDFGDLSRQVDQLGVCSDSHGGL